MALLEPTAVLVSQNLFFDNFILELQETKRSYALWKWLVFQNLSINIRHDPSKGLLHFQDSLRSKENWPLRYLIALIDKSGMKESLQISSAFYGHAWGSHRFKWGNY